MRDKQTGNSPQKKPYIKPEVKQVPLRPEEAVLGGCKMSGTGGPDGADCARATPPYRCNSLMS
jgi:hypothetical protein